MKVYRINWKDQVLSIKYWFAWLLLFLIFAGMAYSSPDNRFGFILILFVLIFGLPPLILHFIYWRLNKNTIFSINQDSLSMSENKTTWEYRLDDIVVAEKHVGVYYKHHGKIAPWTNYGYLKLEMKDGKMFFISSLMLNPRIFDDIPCEIKYDYLPIFNKSTFAEKQKIEEHVNKVEKTKSDELTQKYIEEFQSRSNDELTAKVNDNRYKPEAIAAANKILENRRDIEKNS